LTAKFHQHTRARAKAITENSKNIDHRKKGKEERKGKEMKGNERK